MGRLVDEGQDPWIAGLMPILLLALAAVKSNGVHAQSNPHPKTAIHTSDRCVACHNGLKTSSGEDISIGFQWRASIMANAVAIRIGKPACAANPSIIRKDNLT